MPPVRAQQLTGTDVHPDVSGTPDVPGRQPPAKLSPVPIIPNTEVAPDKTVSLTLSNATPSSFVSLGSPDTATLTIHERTPILSTKVATNTAPTLTVPLNGSCGCGSNFPGSGVTVHSQCQRAADYRDPGCHPGEQSPLPSEFSVTLTWNGTAGSAVDFDTEGHAPRGRLPRWEMQVPSVGNQQRHLPLANPGHDLVHGLSRYH